MPIATATDPLTTIEPTSLRTKLLGILTDPGDVFDEIIASQLNLRNWRGPTLLICLTSFISACMTAPSEILANEPSLPPVQVAMFAGALPVMKMLTICVSAFAGSAWCAFVLWFIGRFLLRTSFSFLKTLEVVGLTSMISFLGTVMTIFLVAATHNVDARPALSLLATKSDHASSLYRLLDALNIFHIWSTGVLAVGLSKLSGVSFREAAFWAFGYWLALRLALVILA